MKKFHTSFIKAAGLLLLFMAVITSCKKNQTTDPVPVPVSGASGTIDGKAINVGESGLSTTYYTTSGDAVSSLMTSAALDANGTKMDFFIPNINSGTYTITPKLGTSSNPGNPNLKVQATTPTTTQTYISYTSTGSVYYAISGSITVTTDDTKISVKWDISFKDATGRVFTSSGNFTIYYYRTVTKPKAEVKDPTPVTVKPTIDNIAPATGIAGDTLSIAGTNFSTTLTDNIVKVNGVAATVKTAIATKLTAIVPAGTTGAVTVKVANSETTSGPTFTYVLPATFTAIAATSGKAGDAVTLTGTNFSTTISDNVVAFNGLNAVVTAATATTLTVTVPANVATGLVTLKVRGKAITPAQGFTPTFTVIVVTIPTVNVGTPGQAYALKGNYLPTVKAFDTEANLYVVDENDQLTKMSYNGEVQKNFAAADFNFTTTQNYKCYGVATDKNGGVHAIVYLGTGNGSGIVCMVSIGLTGKVTKEYNTTVAGIRFSGMAFNMKGEAFILSSQSNNDDVLKLKSDGTYETYLKGGVNGDLGGNGAYGIDFDPFNAMVLLTYKKTNVVPSVPTNVAIYKYDSLKVRTTILSGYTEGYADGALATAQFKDIRAIAVSNLDIFVSDNGNFRIRKIATRTGVVTTVAGNGKQYDPNNGNQPTYTGALLGANIFGTHGLLFNGTNNVLYNFYAGQNNTQKLVLN